jgi:hypothetical protein
MAKKKGTKLSSAHSPDTGYSFVSPKTGLVVLVMKKKGESKEDAIARVRKKHGG